MLRISGCALFGAMFLSAVPAFVQQGPPAPAGPQTDQTPAQGAARGGGAGPAAGQAPGGGRGRGLDLIQDYPADPNEVIQALHGFTVEIVAKADRPKQGSWISITEDHQGRLILGANEQQPFTRLTLDNAGKVTNTEVIFTPVSESMGITWHDNALYVQGGRLEKTFTATIDNPGFGRQSGQAGLHRLRDPKGDGSFTTVDTLRTWDGPEGGHSDHGIHEARVSPDGKHFYIINGNGVIQADDVSPNSPLRNYADDRIIPLLGPQTGRLGHERAPGGHIVRTDFDGKNLHLVSGGMRNALHFDWNADGEIFTFDSDMEPEFGVPWYRPVRVSWLPSGADLGYRGNSGKYPTWYEDSLPPLVEIGLGSPVGVTFGYRTAFPAKYQKALFVADNNYGRIIAVHLQPAGSGYIASSWENVVWPKGLYGGTPRMTHNVTDMIVARDGTFYYVIGSRRAQSYLMKITYVGDQPTAPVEYRNADGAAARALRRSLEAFHWTRNDPKAVAAAWPHLGSEDRFLRFAARVALETVSPDAWKARALAEKDAATSIIAMLALARVGGPTANEDVFASLSKFPLSTLSDPLRIQKLRVIEVAVSRNGKPSEAAIQRVVADVDSVFPGSSFELNTEMSQILSAFNAPTAVEKTMRLMAQSKIYEEQFAYRYNLRSVTTGWTPEFRKTYFAWFNADHGDDQHRYDYREWFNRVNQQPRIAGNAPYLAQVRAAAVATLTDAEKADAELSAMLAAFKEPPARGRGRGAGPAATPPAGGPGAGPTATPGRGAP
jgi:glucose/arabinose dehydrogenase